MFEMRVTIEGADLLKYYLTYADPIDGSLSSRFRNWYIATNCDSVPPQLGYGLSNIQENCWPTKINIAGTANADSIEDARFKIPKFQALVFMDILYNFLEFPIFIGAGFRHPEPSLSWRQARVQDRFRYLGILEFRYLLYGEA